MELEDPKSLESPTTPTTEDFIHAQVQQRLQFTSDDSDDNQSIVTVCPNNTENTLILNPTDPDDYINANVFVKYTPSIIDGRSHSNLQTIVEVVNPMLAGDGTATEIAIGRRNDDASLPSFDTVAGDDDDEHDGVVYRRELSINDKMKNVLKELKENEKVRLSLSRSMDEEDGEEEEEANPNFHQENMEIADNSQATVYANPNVDEFLANEIRHAQATSEGDASLKARRETLTLDLVQSTNEQDNDDDDDEDTATTDTPTTPTVSSTANVNGGKKKRKKNKNKKK